MFEIMNLKTEHSYYRARFYNPYSGRFLNEDPIGFDGKDLNLYRYVRNNPISVSDPSGNGPILGTICFALLPILETTGPAAAYELAGRVYDEYIEPPSNDCKDNKTSGIKKKLFQTAAASIISKMIDKYGDKACLRLFLTPGLP